jgi:hypothetical protein
MFWRAQNSVNVCLAYYTYEMPSKADGTADNAFLPFVTAVIVIGTSVEFKAVAMTK